MSNLHGRIDALEAHLSSALLPYPLPEETAKEFEFSGVPRVRTKELWDQHIQGRTAEGDLLMHDYSMFIDAITSEPGFHLSAKGFGKPMPGDEDLL